MFNCFPLVYYKKKTNKKENNGFCLPRTENARQRNIEYRATSLQLLLLISSLKYSEKNVNN